MRFLVENYPYEVILPTFPEVLGCFQFFDFVTAITYVTDVTAKHGRPLRKSRNHFIGVVFDEESHGDVPRSPFCWRSVVIYHNVIPYWTPVGLYPVTAEMRNGHFDVDVLLFRGEASPSRNPRASHITASSRLADASEQGALKSDKPVPGCVCMTPQGTDADFM